MLYMKLVLRTDEYPTIDVAEAMNRFDGHWMIAAFARPAANECWALTRKEPSAHAWQLSLNQQIRSRLRYPQRSRHIRLRTSELPTIQMFKDVDGMIELVRPASRRCPTSGSNSPTVCET